MMGTLTVDDLEFEVRWSSRRRTVQITVDRGGELVLTAPAGCDPARLTAFVRAKRSWVYSKLAEKETHRQPRGRKEFVTGEGFSYLGRSYRLLLVGAQDRALKLEGGRFKLRRSDAGEGRTHFVEWYTAHACPWLSDRVDRFAGKIGVTPTRIDVRDLGHRWGSCGASGNLNFHWATILLPPSAVEYVVVHELAHLRESRHSPEFWLLVERALPDFERRRRWVAERGAVGAWL